MVDYNVNVNSPRHRTRKANMNLPIMRWLQSDFRICAHNSFHLIAQYKQQNKLHCFLMNQTLNTEDKSEVKRNRMTQSCIKNHFGFGMITGNKLKNPLKNCTLVGLFLCEVNTVISGGSVFIVVVPLARKFLIGIATSASTISLFT